VIVRSASGSNPGNECTLVDAFSANASKWSGWGCNGYVRIASVAPAPLRRRLASSMLSSLPT
jgi:hypothetical protein